jgi:hypothetical protein
MKAAATLTVLFLSLSISSQSRAAIVTDTDQKGVFRASVYRDCLQINNEGRTKKFPQLRFIKWRDSGEYMLAAQDSFNAAWNDIRDPNRVELVIDGGAFPLSKASFDAGGSFERELDRIVGGDVVAGGRRDL